MTHTHQIIRKFTLDDEALLPVYPVYLPTLPIYLPTPPTYQAFLQDHGLQPGVGRSGGGGGRLGGIGATLQGARRYVWSGLLCVGRWEKKTTEC